MDGWVQSTEPTFRYGATPPRSAWIRVRRLLDQYKISVAPAEFSTQSERQLVRLKPVREVSEQTPVVLAQSYSPNWVRDDGGAVFPGVPFRVLLFAEGATNLHYRRSGLAKLGIGASVLGLTVLFVCHLLSKHGLLLRRFEVLQRAFRLGQSDHKFEEDVFQEVQHETEA